MVAAVVLGVGVVAGIGLKTGDRGQEGEAPPEATAERPPVAAPVAAAERPPVAAPVAAGGSPAGCEGPAGTVVGYWYAGADPPGEVGSTLVMPRSARVRADYPRRDNRYLSSAPERCVLLAGDRVLLSHAPILVDGGRWWVPFAAGDLVERR